MADDTWIPTVPESSLDETGSVVVLAKGISIVLVKKSGRVYALRNRCAHMACTLGGGRLVGDTLQCPCHGWKFDIRTGEFIAAREIRIPTYQCRSDGGTVSIRLE